MQPPSDNTGAVRERGSAPLGVARLAARLRAKWLTLILVVTAAVAVGGGAAAGVVMTGDIKASIPLTVSQALISEKPQPHNFPPGRNFFSSVSDDHTKFSMALEMFRGETLSVIVPIVNRSSGDAVAEFTVTLPDIPSLIEGMPGLTMEASGSGIVDDVVKISPDSWTFTADAAAQGLASTPADGLLLKFTVSPTAMAGFFEITGRVRVLEF
jgi:hypothetical protein